MASKSKAETAIESAPTNPRGIPVAPFVDKVEDYVTSREEVEGTLTRFREMISYVDSRDGSRCKGVLWLTWRPSSSTGNTSSWNLARNGGSRG